MVQQAGLLCAEFTMNSTPSKRICPTPLIKVMSVFRTTRAALWQAVRFLFQLSLPEGSLMGMRACGHTYTHLEKCLVILQLSVYTGRDMTLGLGQCRSRVSLYYVAQLTQRLFTVKTIKNCWISAREGLKAGQLATVQAAHQTPY